MLDCADLNNFLESLKMAKDEAWKLDEERLEDGEEEEGGKRKTGCGGREQRNGRWREPSRGRGKRRITR